MNETSKITSGTKEWSDYSLNCLVGCERNCLYCYARHNANRFAEYRKKHGYQWRDHENWNQMAINEKMRNKNFRKRNGRGMFPTSHDIPDNQDYLFQFTMDFLERFLKPGNQVLLTTKPTVKTINYIMENFEQYKDQIQFRFTITSIHQEDLDYWEPNASTFEERLECLKITNENGWKNSVSIEPCLMIDPSLLIGELREFCNGSIWLGIMNYIPRSRITKEYYDKIRLINNILTLKDWKARFSWLSFVKFKDSIKNKLRRA